MVHSNTDFDMVSSAIKDIINEKAGGELKPPYSNTGVLRTGGDYLTFTLHGSNGVDVALSLLGADGWEEKPFGAFNYDGMKTRGHISILFDGKTDAMGVHVRMTGKGMAEFADRADFRGWRQWFVRLLEQDVKIGRFDLAADDLGNLLNMHTIKQQIMERSLTTSYRQAQGIWKVELSKEDLAGETVYLGSRSGSSLIRFYRWDQVHGGDVEFVRCEIELHKEYAHRAVELLAEGRDMGNLVASALASKVNFRVPTEDTNKGRWPIVDWWEKFTSELENLAWDVQKVKTSYSSKLTWILKAVAPSLAMLDEEMEDPFWMDKVLKYGRERLMENPREWDRIRREGVWQCHTRPECEEIDPFKEDDIPMERFFSDVALVVAGALPVYGEEYSSEIVGVPHWAGD